MATKNRLPAESFRVRLRDSWASYSNTLLGDIIATVIVVLVMSGAFVVFAGGAIVLVRGAGLLFHLRGG